MNVALPGPIAALWAQVRRRAKGPVYLVGGALRDALHAGLHGTLRRAANTGLDLDVACRGPAKSLAADLARGLGGRLVVLDEDTRVYRVVLTRGGAGERGQIDVAQVQGASIETDLKRRDFTINAMALDASGRLLDPRGGFGDIKRRRLRTENGDVFREDPLRILRAFRLAAQLDLGIDPGTQRLLRLHRKRARKPAGERLRRELMSLLSVTPSHPWLRLMDRLGVLTCLFPPLEPSRRCAETYYGKGGVLRHALDAVERMDFLLADPDSALPGFVPDIRRHFEGQGGSLERQAPLLRLGALLHDIAKPATARRVEGRLRFFGHEERGAVMAERLLRELRFSGAEIQALCAWVRHHLRPGNLAVNPAVSDKAVFRFFRDLGPHGIGLLLVSWADHASYLPGRNLKRLLRLGALNPRVPLARFGGNPETRKSLHHLRALGSLLRSYFRKPEKVRPPKLVDGHDVMKTLGLPPGPLVGEALASIQEAQAEGKIKDREHALRHLRLLRPAKVQNRRAESRAITRSKH